jgi:hypothetical protein
MNNPNKISIDLAGASGNASGYITCTVSASYNQKVVVKVTDKNQIVVADGTFEGSGLRNVTLPLQDGKTVLNFDSAELPLTLYYESFYNSGSGYVHNKPDNVLFNQHLDTRAIEALQITSEDWIDNDFNDTILTFVAVSHNTQ